MRCTYHLNVVVVPSPGLRSFSKTLVVDGTIPICLHHGDRVCGLPGPSPLGRHTVDHITWFYRFNGISINLENLEMPSDAEAKQAVKILIRSGWKDLDKHVNKILAEHDRKEKKKGRKAQDERR